MKNELTKWSFDKALKNLGDLTGKSIMIGDTHLIGVTSIEFEEEVICDSDPDESIGYDGGKQDYIRIIFHIGDGKVSHSYCPNIEICHYWHELDDLICFSIESIPEFVKRQKFDLDFKLSEYEEYMKK